MSMHEDDAERGQTFYVMATNTTPPGVTSINYDIMSDVMGNVTNSNITMPVRDEELAQIEIGVQAFIFCLALVGNSCVLLALRYRKKKTSRMHLFIMHLSIADLLVAFCNVLPQLAWDVTYRFKGPDVLCRVVKYLQVMVVYLSTYVLVMTAVDRYRAICHPLSNYSWSSKRVHAMIGTAWVLSMLLSIPQLLIFRLTEVSPGVYDCWGHFGETEWVMKAYITCFMLSVYILPFFILVLLYGRISYELWWNLRCKRAGYPDGCALNGKIVYKFNGTGTISIISPNNTNTHEQDLSGSSIYRDREREWEQHQLQRDPYLKRLQGPNRCQCQCHNSRHGNRTQQLTFPRPHSYRGLSRSKMKTIKLTFVVILAYLFCWSPFFITQMWWAYDKHAPASSSTFVICLLLASLNSCCNPWIYMAFSTNFIQSVIPCCCTRQRPPPPYHHHRVCSLDEGRAPSSSKSSSKSLTPDENTQNRMEKNLLDSRKHGSNPRLPGGKSLRGGAGSGTPSAKCVNCGAAVTVECKGGVEVAQQPPVAVNSWRWRCNLFPSSCKTRGGPHGGFANTLRGQLDMEQCQPLHQIQEEQLPTGIIGGGGTPSDPARSAENRVSYDGLARYRRPSLERYLQDKKPRKSLSQPSLFCGRRSNSDEQIEVRCTSV